MIDKQRFRDLMAGVCAPVTVVTTMHDGVPHGATVSSLTSLSLDPPLISVAFDQGSALLRRIRQAAQFGVNLLGAAQDELAVTFARRGVDRFGSVAWFADDGLPRLAGAAGWMVCDLYREVDGGGDHQLLFGLVQAACRTDLPPLVYAYRTFGTHSRFAARPRAQVVDMIVACAS
jgi:flavin reductase (DIM6/NTAB) family NADH-FMN oxidoreductase RutF